MCRLTLRVAVVLTVVIRNTSCIAFGGAEQLYAGVDAGTMHVAIGPRNHGCTF